MLQAGIRGYETEEVTADHTALHMGSGTLEVYATPAMIALIEKTAWKSVEEHLESGQGSVGTRLAIDHVSATPLGMKISCKTLLTKVEGRKLVFEAEVSDETGVIGRGTHERFIIDKEKFVSRANQKKGQETR